MLGAQRLVLRLQPSDPRCLRFRLAGRSCSGAAGRGGAGAVPVDPRLSTLPGAPRGHQRSPRSSRLAWTRTGPPRGDGTRRCSSSWPGWDPRFLQQCAGSSESTIRGYGPWIPWCSGRCPTAAPPPQWCCSRRGPLNCSPADLRPHCRPDTGPAGGARRERAPCPTAKSFRRIVGTETDVACTDRDRCTPRARVAREPGSRPVLRPAGGSSRRSRRRRAG